MTSAAVGFFSEADMLILVLGVLFALTTLVMVYGMLRAMRSEILALGSVLSGLRVMLTQDNSKIFRTLSEHEDRLAEISSRLDKHELDAHEKID